MTYRRCICHPDDLPGVGISSGWVTANSLCHPDDILFHFMSSGWLNWGWFLIRMSYGNVIMSSGWDTLPFLSHPDEIANFDFPQHAVALQRFRSIPWKLWEILGEILKMIHFCRFLCIYFFWTLQIPFVVHNTTHVSYIIVTKFICGWCQAICSKLRCQMLEFPLCLPNIPNFWPVV